MSAWFLNIRDTRTIDTIEVSTVKGFIEDTPCLKYWMSSYSIKGGISANITGKSVIKAIDKGHLDLEVLVYINPKYKTVVYNPQPRTRWEFNGRTQSWLLDLDDVSDICSISQLRTVMIARNVPEPYYIVQTGPHNFHCFYHGHAGQWSRHKQKWLVSKWAGVSVDLPKDEWDKAVAGSGVCLNHFYHNYADHHMRVPGSLNFNHKNADGTFWRCIGWKNAAYKDSQNEFVAEVAVPIPDNVPGKNVVALGNLKPRFNPESYIESVTTILEGVFPQGLMCIKLDRLARMIANNVMGLAFGTCRIHQDTWARELGVSQFDISRLLKRLRDLGVLELTIDSYMIGNYSKTYGAGGLLRPAIGQMGKPLPCPQWVRWDRGTSNARMLVDVRYFCSLGLTDVEIVKRLQERQAHRKKNKQRSVNDFLYAIRKFREWLRDNSLWSRSWTPQAGVDQTL